MAAGNRPGATCRTGRPGLRRSAARQLSVRAGVGLTAHKHSRAERGGHDSEHHEGANRAVGPIKPAAGSRDRRGSDRRHRGRLAGVIPPNEVGDKRLLRHRLFVIQGGKPRDRRRRWRLHPIRRDARADARAPRNAGDEHAVRRARAARWRHLPTGVGPHNRAGALSLAQDDRDSSRTRVEVEPGVRGGRPGAAMITAAAVNVRLVALNMISPVPLVSFRRTCVTRRRVGAAPAYSLLLICNVVSRARKSGFSCASGLGVCWPSRSRLTRSPGEATRRPGFLLSHGLRHFGWPLGGVGVA